MSMVCTYYSTRCPLCNAVLGIINDNHLRRHKITSKEFNVYYPEYRMHVNMGGSKMKNTSVADKLLAAKIPQDEKQLVEELYNRGCTHIEITHILSRHRKIMKVETTPEQCSQDVQNIISEIERG